MRALVAVAHASALRDLEAPARVRDLALEAAGSWIGVHKPRRSTLLSGRKGLAEALVEHQRDLEALGAVAHVLPVAPGVILRNGAAVRAAILANEAAIGPVFERIAPWRQYEIKIAWDVKLALELVRRDPAVGAWDGLVAEPEKLAAAMQAALEAQRARLAADYTARLSEVAAEILEMPRADESVIAHFVAAAPAAALSALEAAVEAIDASWPEGLRIKLVGPSAPYSFALMRLEPIDAAALRAATQRLGLAADATLEAVDAAFRAQAKTAHPDLGGAEGALQRLEADRALLREIALWRDGLLRHGLAAARPQPPRAVFDRDPGLARAA